jgi:hypothetical protein
MIEDEMRDTVTDAAEQATAKPGSARVAVRVLLSNTAAVRRARARRLDLEGCGGLVI